MVTLPITDAEGAMKLLAPGRVGARPSTDTIRLEGTNRSVYFATSILAPMLSSVALLLLFFWVGTEHTVGTCCVVKQTNNEVGPN